MTAFQHVVASTYHDGRLWHTIRFDNGAWAALREVPGSLAVTSADCSAVASELHVVAVTDVRNVPDWRDGMLWHAIRRADGTWTGFGDVEAQAGDRGYFGSVSCAELGGDLHVCGVSVDPGGDRRLWHTIRRQDGSWAPFGDIEAQTGETGTFVEASCAAIGGELHVCATTTDYPPPRHGRLWHTIRHLDGRWEPFGDVEAQAGERGLLSYVGCAAVGGELHVLVTSRPAAGSSGSPALVHTIRRADGTWVPFGDLAATSAAPPGNFPVLDVNCMGDGADLVVTMVNYVGGLWHTIRSANGTWVPFGDVEAAAGERGSFYDTSCAVLPEAAACTSIRSGIAARVARILELEADIAAEDDQRVRARLIRQLIGVRYELDRLKRDGANTGCRLA